MAHFYYANVSLSDAEIQIRSIGAFYRCGAAWDISDAEVDQ